MMRIAGLVCICTLLGGCLTEATVPWQGDTPAPSPTPTVNPADFLYTRGLSVTAGTDYIDAGYVTWFEFDAGTAITEGKLELDGADLRVTYNAGEVPWAIDPGSQWTDPDAKIWFRTVSDVSNGDTDTGYAIYYGDSDAIKPSTRYTDILDFHDDLETGDLGAWDDVDFTNGAIAVTPARSRSGIYSLEITDAASVVEQRSLPAGSMYAEMQIWVPSGFGGVPLIGFAQGETTLGTFGLTAAREPVVFDGTGADVLTGAAAVPTARWHRLGFAFSIESGELMVWVDNNVTGPVSSLSGPTQFDRITLGTAGVTQAVPTFWIDDWSYRPWRPSEPTTALDLETAL